MPKVKESYTEEKKEFILHCTKEALKEKAINQLTMRDVIRKTGFSQGTIYQYYKNLGEILNVIICRYMHRMKEEMESCLEKETEFNRCYEAVCNCMVSLYKESPVLFEAVMGEVSYSKGKGMEKDVLYEIYLVGEELNEMIIRILKKGMESGIVESGLNLHVTVFYMWSSIGQTILFSSKKKEYIRQQLGMDEEEYRRQSFELIIKSVRKSG